MSRNAKHAQPSFRLTTTTCIHLAFAIAVCLALVMAASSLFSGTHPHNGRAQLTVVGGQSARFSGHSRPHPPASAQYINRMANRLARPVVTFPYQHTVQPNETLSSIAFKAYGRGDAWTLIYNANHLTSTIITSGTQLKIVALVGSPPAPPALPRAPQAALVAPSSSSAPPSSSPPTTAVSAPAPTGSLQSYAASLWGSQYSCGASVVNVESGWNIYARNPSSGAYGIPQALPGSKMASAGADWATNGYTQLRWMTGYMNSTYGGPCGAWTHEQSAGWY
jgi:LysM repeat protein